MEHSCWQGKLAEADFLLGRAIEIKEALGPDHPSLANSLATRATVLQEQVWVSGACPASETSVDHQHQCWNGEMLVANTSAVFSSHFPFHMMRRWE